jgi:hypothetical protein
MSMRPLMIGPEQQAMLDNLRQLAATKPIDLRGLVERLRDNPDEMARHRQQMTSQSVVLPVDYLVTFSIEIGHPQGTVRHMSISVPVKGKVPHVAAIFMIAEALGFINPPDGCHIWGEDTEDHGKAVNIIQLVAVVASSPDEPH